MRHSPCVNYKIHLEAHSCASFVWQKAIDLSLSKRQVHLKIVQSQRDILGAKNNLSQFKMDWMIYFLAN